MSNLRNSLPEFTQHIKTLSDFESLIAVALGLINGTRPEIKFGHCSNTGITETDIWELGGTQPTYIFPSELGEQIEIVSNNAADTGITISINGLDENGEDKSVSAILNGTTPVPLPGLWSAVNRTFNDSNIEFIGTVSVRGDGTTSTNVFAILEAEAQQTSQAIYTVPVNKVAIVSNFSTAVNKTGGSSVSCIYSLKVASFGKVFRTQIRYGLQREGTSNISSDLIVPGLLGPRSRAKISALPTSASTDVSGEFSMLLVDKELVPQEILNTL